MTRKRIVWKDDELRGKNIEAKRDVAEELRQDVRRNSLERQCFVLERQRHEMLRYGTGLSRKGNELYGKAERRRSFARLRSSLEWH
nr:MAG TPA: hypothetical protein [Caudoviricetes sp.]